MEINITKFFNAAAPMDYSASVAEIGAQAGADTWRAAMDDASDYPELLDSDEKREAFKEHIRGFGAWEDVEIAVMGDNGELTALFMQLIAGDMREAGLDADSSSEDWREASESSSGNLFLAADGQIYYYLGS